MRWFEVWHLEYRFNKNSSFGEFEMTVQQGNFLNYLYDKLTIYPIYINTNHAWYRLNCPYWIELEPEQLCGGHSVLLEINKTISISIPNISDNRKHQFVNHITQTLLSWIEEEYEFYRSEWKAIAGY